MEGSHHDLTALNNRKEAQQAVGPNPPTTTTLHPTTEDLPTETPADPPFGGRFSFLRKGPFPQQKFGPAAARALQRLLIAVHRKRTDAARAFREEP